MWEEPLGQQPGCGEREGSVWASPARGPPWALAGALPHALTCPQLFITVMDKLRLEIRAMDEVRGVGGGGAGGVKGGGRRGLTGRVRMCVCRSSLTCGS